MQLELSSEIKSRNLKIMFWGKTATRKTETILRNFPNVLLIDTEGNSDQCVGVEEIPPFMRLKTKNAREIMEVLDKVSESKIKFPDGKPVETVAIDSWSIVWSVAQEVAAVSAEKRAAKKGFDVEGATMTQLDWVLAKRLPKRILNRLNGSAVKYLVLVSREKDQYLEKGGELVKQGVTPDVIRGTEYEMNLVLHFDFDANNKWCYEVTKVQGALSRIFPMNGKGTEFPINDLISYASSYNSEVTRQQDEDEIAKEIVTSESASRTYTGLMEFGARFGYRKDEISTILKSAGFTSFKKENWDAMCHELIRCSADKSGGSVLTL